MLEQPIGSEAAKAAKIFDLARTLTLAILVGLAIVIIGMLLLFGGRAIEVLALHLAFRQDLPLVLVFVATALLRPKARDDPAEWLKNGRLVLWLSIAVIMIAGWAGQYLVFHGIQLSRDEQMAIFDQGIFAQGQALWPIPLEWRSMADALGRRFMLPIGANEYWVSAYLPVHAAFRGLLSRMADPALTSPLFTVLAVVCTWGIARKLWPQSTGTAAVGLILLATSSQVLVMSMTSFSMSMHLGLNLLWLLLFLKDRWWAHVLAVVVAFFATGIHQPLFHPLFALPFCVLLLTQRKWGVAAFYAVSYALIAAAWMAYPLWIVSHGVAPAIPIDCANSNCSSGVGFLERLRATIGALGLVNIWLTATNLLRFFIWQNPLMPPLALFGAISYWRSEPLVKALAASFLLPIVVMAFLLPWQGHGWGYRYVHPVLGNAVLLACYGFHRLQQNGLSLRRPLAITTGAAVALLALHAWMAAQFVQPFVQIRDQLAAIDADAVIVDTDQVPFGQDVVVNRFDLSNRPKLLIATLLKPEDLPKLCSMGTIAFFDGPRMTGLSRLFNARPPVRPSPDARALHSAAEAANCHIIR